jgi:hypothetical protein
VAKMNSAAPYRLPKKVLVQAVVISEPELRHIEWQVLLADLVVSADHSTLNQAPEALNRVGMDSASDVLAARMVDSAMGVFAALVCARFRCPSPKLGALA